MATRSPSSLVSRGNGQSNTGTSRSSVLGPTQPRNTFSERSTLTSFRNPTATSSFRGNTTRPSEPLNGGYTTHNYYSPSFYSYGYSWPGYYAGYYSGTGFYFGYSSSWWSASYYSHYYSHYYSPWGYNPYSGSFAAAFLVGTAWHIVPYVSLGWCGYNWGSYCTYWPWGTWRHRHRYHYHGLYFSVLRPYWYGYSRWYDYRPYSYSYVSLNYDSLYDDGYDDGYGKGYNRGYEDGADDASGYKDNRRRDQIGSKPRPRVPDSSIDRAKTDAAEEYRYEMNRGTDAFTSGDFKTATKAYKEAVILNPESADARYSLAISAFAEGKYAFAAFALRRGVALDAEKSRIDLERVFGDPVVLKDYVDSLNAELKDNPEDPDLLLLSGYVALRTGDASAAAERLDRALKQSPQDTAAQQLQREAMKALEEE
ncbi:MAG: tetratricopeptide repeat protein [Planctomycetes bacterium]|nr:tetratricopeptide repeat protein [Planctomycetota bacterium]